MRARCVTRGAAGGGHVAPPDIKLSRLDATSPPAVAATPAFSGNMFERHRRRRRRREYSPTSVAATSPRGAQPNRRN